MSPGRRRAALGPPAAPEPSVLGARFWRAVRLPVPRREGGPAQRLDLGGRRAAMASPPLAAAAAVGSGGEASSGSEETGTEPPGRDLAALFEQAAERLPSLLPTASKEQLLYLYARYKQVRRDRGGPARPGPTRGLSPGAPRPSVGQSWGPGRRSGTGTGPVREWPGLGLSRPRACVATTRNVTTPSGKSCVGGCGRGGCGELSGQHKVWHRQIHLWRRQTKPGRERVLPNSSRSLPFLASPPRPVRTAPTPHRSPLLRRRRFGCRGLRGGAKAGVGVEDLAFVVGCDRSPVGWWSVRVATESSQSDLMGKYSCLTSVCQAPCVRWVMR